MMIREKCTEHVDETSWSHNPHELTSVTNVIITLFLFAGNLGEVPVTSRVKNNKRECRSISNNNACK